MLNFALSRTSARRSALALLTLTALLAAGTDCRAEYLTGSWVAKDVKGVLFPPAYGLRLDGLFGGSAAVTFTYSPGVTFTALDNGTATLTGQITVNRNDGAAVGNGTSWQLDVHFTDIGEDGALRLYSIDAGSKMTLVGDAGTVVEFRNTVTMDAPFQVGPGAVDDKPAYPYRTNNVFTGAGWVDYRVTGDLFSGLPTRNGAIEEDDTIWYHTGSDDFLFDLSSDDVQHVPAPGALSLGLLGTAGLGFYRRYRRRES